MTTGDPDIDAQIASEMASIISLEATLDQTRAQLAAAERTIEQLRATRQGLLDDLVKAAGREIALQETIEQLGQDAAAIAGELDAVCKQRDQLMGRLNALEWTRPKVLAFARIMEEKLRENDHKGDMCSRIERGLNAIRALREKL